jgi:uncharacterized protein DUF6262
MRADNTAAIIAAAQRRHELTRAKAIRALRELNHAGAPVTFEAVARAAGVSRSWLYAQPGVRAEIERLRRRTRRAPSPAIPAGQRASDTSLHSRLQAALEHNRKLAEDNQRLRRQLAQALGDQRATSRTGQTTTPRRTATAASLFDNDPALLNPAPQRPEDASATPSTTHPPRPQP